MGGNGLIEVEFGCQSGTTEADHVDPAVRHEIPFEVTGTWGDAVALALVTKSNVKKTTT